MVITAPRGNDSAKQVNTEQVENKMKKVLDPTSWDDERRRESAFNEKNFCL